MNRFVDLLQIMTLINMVHAHACTGIPKFIIDVANEIPKGMYTIIKIICQTCHQSHQVSVSIQLELLRLQKIFV